MPNDYGQVPWTAEQWQRVRTAVQETARKAGVASAALPLYGPVPASDMTVPALPMTDATLSSRERGEAPQFLDVDSAAVLRLTTVSVDVYLRHAQVSDPELAAAVSMFCRAADIISRLEDTIVFRGQPGPGQAPPPALQPVIYNVSNGQTTPGLLASAAVQPVPAASGGNTALPATFSEGLVAAVSGAIGTLEGAGHYGPFACILGNFLFEAAQTPSPGSLVLPSDRIKPFLEGPLLRSSAITDLPSDENGPATRRGVIVSLAGSPIDLAVGTDIDVKFIQVNVEPRYVFRVSERFVLRIKQPAAAVVLHT